MDKFDLPAISRRRFNLGLGAGLAAATVSGFSGGTARAATLENAKANGVLRVGFFQTPPVSFVDASGAFTGVSVETARRIGQDNGIANILGSVLEFDGLIPGLTSGQFDVIVSSLFIRPSRCEVVAFSNPDTKAGLGLAAKAGNPLKITKIEDIAASSNIRLGGLAGTYEIVVAKDLGVRESQIMEFPNDDAMYNGLAADRVDVIISSDIYLGRLVMLKDNPNYEMVADFEQPVIDGAPTFNYGGFVFRKTDEDLLEIFNKGIVDLISSGWMSENFKKFGLTDAQIPPSDVTSDALCSS